MGMTDDFESSLQVLYLFVGLFFIPESPWWLGASVIIILLCNIDMGLCKHYIFANNKILDSGSSKKERDNSCKKATKNDNMKPHLQRYQIGVCFIAKMWYKLIQSRSRTSHSFDFT